MPEFKSESKGGLTQKHTHLPLKILCLAAHKHSNYPHHNSSKKSTDVGMNIMPCLARLKGSQIKQTQETKLDKARQKSLVKSQNTGAHTHPSIHPLVHMCESLWKSRNRKEKRAKKKSGADKNDGKQKGKRRKSAAIG